MKITRLSREILADKPETLRALFNRPFRLNKKETGTFVEGATFPEFFGNYAIVLPRGGAIIPGVNPEELGEMISWATHDRFHFLRDNLERDLREIFGIPVQLGFSTTNRQDHWTLRVFSPMIPMDWWNEDCGADEILTECFFQGSAEPMANFHDLENWKRHIQENAAIRKQQREQQKREEEAFLNDATRSLRITMFISNTKSCVVMDMTGTPVQLLRHVFENVWAWKKKLEVYKRGFRFQLNGIGRKEDWIFYASVNDLCAALKSRWPVAYERAEQQQ